MFHDANEPIVHTKGVRTFRSISQSCTTVTNPLFMYRRCGGRMLSERPDGRLCLYEVGVAVCIRVDLCQAL